MNKQILRSQVPEALTWDLTSLFESDEAWEQAYQAVEKENDDFIAYKGKLNQSASILLEAFEKLLTISRQFENVYVYAHLKNDQDTTNSEYQALYDRARTLATKVGQNTAWFNPEVLEIDEKRLKQFFEEESKLKDYKHAFNQITSKRAHVLPADQEVLLAGAGDVLNSGSQTFGILNNADMNFPTIEDGEGNAVQLTHGTYGQLMESTTRSVRKNTFKKYYQEFQNLNNTFASTLQSEIKKNNYLSQVRGYGSAREKALAANNIPETVHTTLIEMVNEYLPLFHRYLNIRKDLLGLDELHMYDMYTPITGENLLNMSYDEAKEITLKSLSILGEEYQTVLNKAFEDGWIDVVENKGKRSGAYSSGSYDSNPYVLMNWHDSLNQLYTLVHELGHSAHSYFTRNYQPYVYGDYSIFLAEIASTTNENLLTQYLLDDTDDLKVKASVLNHFLDGFKGTVFRQTQFAEFEHKIHQDLAGGQPLTADYLNRQYQQINEKYYGELTIQDKEIQYEWSRIPHFYMNYYVYQYATGFCAATALADNILTKDQKVLEKYLTYLKAGSSDYPIQVMKKAGVDMTNGTYIQKAMEVFESRLDEFEKVVSQLKDK